MNRYGRENVFIVSKAGMSIQKTTLDWFHHHEFFPKTSFMEENVHFCKERRDKADISRKLKLTHFIDDTLVVLSYLLDVIPNLYLFNADPIEKQNHYMYFMPNIHKIHGNWPQLEDIFIKNDLV